MQLIGGMVLYEGKIAEMATGEGKTFVAPLACYMKVLEGHHGHVVTVNDYLVRRDANWIRPAFENLGLSVGYIQQDMEPGGETRRKMYECDVTYGTNSEFGFDYLRDNMKVSVQEQVQGSLDYAIVDEVDCILIDEARTPLIISGAAHDDAPKYRAADAVARKLLELNKPWDENERKIDAGQARDQGRPRATPTRPTRKTRRSRRARARRRGRRSRLEELEEKKTALTQYYEVELDRKSVHMTHEGIAAAQDAAGVGSFYVGNNMEWPHLMEQSLRATWCTSATRTTSSSAAATGRWKSSSSTSTPAARWSGGSGPMVCTRPSKPKSACRSRPKRRRSRPSRCRTSSTSTRPRPA